MTYLYSVNDSSYTLMVEVESIKKAEMIKKDMEKQGCYLGMFCGESYNIICNFYSEFAPFKLVNSIDELIEQAVISQ